MYSALEFSIFVAGLAYNFQFLWLKSATRDDSNSFVVLHLAPFLF